MLFVLTDQPIRPCRRSIRSKSHPAAGTVLQPQILQRCSLSCRALIVPAKGWNGGHEISAEDCCCARRGSGTRNTTYNATELFRLQVGIKDNPHHKPDKPSGIPFASTFGQRTVTLSRL